MTRIFSAGAEAGSVGVFSSVGAGISASTVRKRTGAYSFLLTMTSTGWSRVTLSADKTTLYFRIGLYLAGLQLTGTWSNLIQLLDNLGGDQVSLSINLPTYTIAVLRGSNTGTVLGTSVNSVPLNQWCCIEWYVKIDDGVAGASTVKMDGATEITIPAADTKATAVAGAKSVLYGTNGSGSINGYIDDLAVNDTAGAVNNSWIGRGGIYGIVPEGVGNYADLLASAGNAWDCIEEVPPNDADYVYESTVGKKSTYAGSVLTPTTGTIDCINVIMRAKLDAAGTGNIARLIRSNGVDSQGADVGLDTSPKIIQENIELNPDGSVAWTVATVNALEVGAVVR